MKNIADVKILVIGDIMLDKYVVGAVERISPEAPVPVVNVTGEYISIGGSGNVVRNLREIGCQVDCLASIGPDIAGEDITEELKAIGARPLLFRGSTKTTVKERIISDHRQVQMLRIDREDTTPIDSLLTYDIFTRMCKDEYDMVVVSDYAKGLVTGGVINFLKSDQKARIIVDPKPQHTHFYNGVYMITPNEKEWEQMIKFAEISLRDIDFILETRGSKGMRLVDNKKETSQEIEAEPVKIFNVSGAGDTVVAVMSVCLSLGLVPSASAKIANKCAGYVVTQPGTSVVSQNIFMKNLSSIIGG